MPLRKRINFWKTWWVVGILLISVTTGAPAFALKPSEIAVVVNKSVWESTSLAEYYMEKREIPNENLIAIRTTAKETCSRLDYVEEIETPVREALQERVAKGEIRALLLMYGVPLIVLQPEITKIEKQQVKSLEEERKTIKAILQKNHEEIQTERLNLRLATIDKGLKSLRRQNFSAAVDSELSLVMAGSYPLKDWIMNPFYIGSQDQKKDLLINKSHVLMVARLDGPTSDIVRRMIDDAIFAEQKGLTGRAYFDATHPRPLKVEKLQGSAFYDYSLHLAAERVRSSNRMPVILDETKELFQSGDAPGAALYCGWYSLARYIDAFTWTRGAVGYHMASQECQTLRGNGSYWCKSMLEDGIAATIGPVSEPYLQAFPLPEVFFSYFIDGYYTLVESYYLSLPWLSWQMILVGDPLYRPFRNLTN